MEPVVVAVVEVAGLGVGVADAPSGHDFFLHVRDVVVVGILEKKEARGLRNDEATLAEDKTRGDVEPLREDRELVGLAIAIGVLADADAVAADAVLGDFVRVVGGLGEPAASALVPGHRDRFADVGVAGEKFEFQISRHLGALHRAFRRKGLLEGERFGALLVVGDIGILDPLLAFLLCQERRVGGPALVADAPENAALEELVKFRQAPDALVVTRGGVENAALTLRADPGPGFGFGDVVILRHLAHLEDGAVLHIVVFVHVGLVPGLETGHILDRLVIGRDRLRTEDRGLVMGETAADDLVEFGDVLETPARAVNWHETAAALDEGFQVFPVRWFDLRVVRVEKDGVVVREKLLVSEGGLGRRDVVEPDRIATERLHQHGCVDSRGMVIGFMTDEEDADGAGAVLGVQVYTGEEEQGQGEGKEGRSHETGVFR